MDNRLHGDLKIDIQNSSISHHTQGGIIIELTAKLRFTITDSLIEGNSITSPKNVLSAAADLGVFSGQPDNARVTIRGTLFANNQDLRSMPMVVWVSRAVNLEIEDSEFKNNHGSAIRAANIKDGLCLARECDFSQQHSTCWWSTGTPINNGELYASVVFESNHAHSVGGAIFVESGHTP